MNPIITIIMVLLTISLLTYGLPSRLNEIQTATQPAVHNAQDMPLKKPAIIANEPPTLPPAEVNVPLVAPEPPSAPRAMDNQDKHFFNLPVNQADQNSDKTKENIEKGDKSNTGDKNKQVVHQDMTGKVTHYEVETKDGHIIDIDCTVLKDTYEKDGDWEFSVRESECKLTPRVDKKDDKEVVNHPDVASKPAIEKDPKVVNHGEKVPDISQRDHLHITQHFNDNDDNNDDGEVFITGREEKPVTVYAIERVPLNHNIDESDENNKKPKKPWYDSATDWVAGAWHKSKDATVGAWDSTKQKFGEVGEKFKHDHRHDDDKVVKSDVELTKQPKEAVTLHHRPDHIGHDCDNGDLECEEYNKKHNKIDEKDETKGPYPFKQVYSQHPTGDMDIINDKDDNDKHQHDVLGIETKPMTTDEILKQHQIKHDDTIPHRTPQDRVKDRMRRFHNHHNPSDHHDE